MPFRLSTVMLLFILYNVWYYHNHNHLHDNDNNSSAPFFCCTLLFSLVFCIFLFFLDPQSPTHLHIYHYFVQHMKHINEQPQHIALLLL